MAFDIPKDAVRTSVSSYTLGSGSLTVADASQFPTPTVAAPILFTVCTITSYAIWPETYCTYQATGLTGSTFSGLTVISGTDTAWTAGDIVEMRCNALHISQLQTAITGYGAGLTPTAVKTGAYNAVVGDFVPVDCTSASVTITLPTAPVDKSVIGVKLIAVSAAFVCTVARGGTDVFNKTAGSTSLTLDGLMQSIYLQYKASGGIWYVLSADNSPANYTQGTNVTITTSGGTRTIAAAGGSPGGSSGQLQYNNASAFGGASAILRGSSGQLNLASMAAPGSPANGDMWQDSTQGCMTRFSRGMTGYSRELVFRMVTPVTNTASGAVTLISTTGALGTPTLPANALNVIGRMMVIKARGYATTPAATPGNISVIFKLGATIFATTQAIIQNVSKNSLGFVIELESICKTTGASGTLDSTGALYSGSAGSTPLTGSSNFPIQNGTVDGTQAPGTNVTLDFTGSLLFDLQWHYTLTTSSVTLTSCDIYLEA